MSNYSRILNQFVQKVGCNQGDRFNEYGINRSLDKLLQSNTGQNEFNRDVSMQIFEQAPKNHDGTVTLRDYINTILRANQILHRQISQTQRQIQYSQNPTERQELQGNLDQFTEDLTLVNKTFNLPGPSRESGSYKLANSYGQASRSRASGSRMAPRDDSKVNASNNASGIFASEPSDHQESTSLKIALIVLLIAVLFELVLMFVKDPFISCLAYIFVFGIYLLNYFDRSYVRLCLYAMLTSVIMDIIWLIVMVGPFMNQTGGYRSNLQPGFLKFAYVMTIILMFAKVLIMIILFRYRSNTESTRKSVKLFNIRFDLDGRPVNSPVFNLLNKTDTSNAAGGMY